MVCFPSSHFKIKKKVQKFLSVLNRFRYIIFGFWVFVLFYFLHFSFLLILLIFREVAISEMVDFIDLTCIG